MRVELLDRLATEQNAWLCTLRADGSPHVTPVWFIYRGPVWWVCSSEHNRKTRNVAADPRVSLALENGVAPVVAEGLATIHRPPFPAELRAAFAEKYGGWDITMPEPNPRAGGRVLLEMPVRRWLLAGLAQ